MKFYFILLAFLGFIVLGYAQDDEVIVEEIHEERVEPYEHINQIDQTINDEVIVEEPAPEVETPAAAQVAPQELTMETLMSEEFQATMEEQLKNNPLKNIDREVLKESIRTQTAGKPVAKLFKFAPVTLEITVDFIRDDQALLGLIKLMKKKEALKNYAIIWVALVIIFWWIKKKLIPAEIPFLKRFMLRTMLSLLSMSITISIFYSMFEEEIKPTWKIIKQHLF